MSTNNLCFLHPRLFVVSKLMLIKSHSLIVVECLFGVFETFTFQVLFKMQAFHRSKMPVSMIFIFFCCFFVVTSDGHTKKNHARYLLSHVFLVACVCVISNTLQLMFIKIHLITNHLLFNSLIHESFFPC